jgi:hypothetical protein
LLGDKPIIIEHFFMGSRGVFKGSIMGSQNIMGSDYGSNISGDGQPRAITYSPDALSF